MFNDDDVNEISGMNGRVPDGVIDASSYAQILCDIVDLIEDFDPERVDKSILFMTKCINLAYTDDENNSEFSQTRALDVINGLTFNIMSLYEMLDKEQRAEFIRFQKEESLPETVEQCKALPFYDLEDEVNNILSIFDEIADGDYSNVTFITPDMAKDYGIDLGDDETSG